MHQGGQVRPEGRTPLTCTATSVCGRVSRHARWSVCLSPCPSALVSEPGGLCHNVHIPWLLGAASAKTFPAQQKPCPVGRSHNLNPLLRATTHNTTHPDITKLPSCWKLQAACHLGTAWTCRASPSPTARQTAGATCSPWHMRLPARLSCGQAPAPPAARGAITTRLEERLAHSSCPSTDGQQRQQQSHPPWLQGRK